MAKKLDRKILQAGARTVLEQLANYRREIIVLSGLSLLSALANGLVPYIVGRLIDSVTSPATTVLLNRTFPTVIVILGLWLIVQLIASTTDWVTNSRVYKLGGYLYSDYLVRGFGHLLNLPLSFHKQHKIGEITSKIQQSASVVEDLAQNVILRLAPQFLSIITALFIIFRLQPQLSFIILGGLVIYLFVFVLTIRPLAGLQVKTGRQWGRAHGNAYDAVFNVKAIKEAATEKHEAQKMYRDFHQRAAAMGEKLIQLWQNLSFYQRVTILFTQLAVFASSIYLIQNGSMTIGELVSFNAYAGMVFGPFSVLAGQWVTIQNGLITLDFSEKIIRTPTERYHPPMALKPVSLAGNIKFEGVNYYYERNKPVLKNINFEVKAGEVVALVGESGVGKSTLIDLISGYHFARRGRVLIDGYDIKDLDLTFLRSQIAVVPQEVVLFNDKIKNNIKYGNFDASDVEVIESARRAFATDFIERFPNKWNQVVGERGVKLSTGQKQRVAIARAVLRKPKILILDEPTSALDAHSEHVITESLEQLMTGRTTFIIAHRLSTVRKADKILVFKNGEVVEAGQHQELLEREGGTYRRLYELQVGLHK